METTIVYYFMYTFALQEKGASALADCVACWARC